MLQVFPAPHLSLGFVAAFSSVLGCFHSGFFPSLHQECDQPEEGQVGSVTNGRDSSPVVMRLSPNSFLLP